MYLCIPSLPPLNVPSEDRCHATTLRLTNYELCCVPGNLPPLSCDLVKYVLICDLKEKPLIYYLVGSTYVSTYSRLLET